MPFQCIEPEKLYAKDPDLKREDVKILQEWLKKQPHLPEVTELQVILMLFSCYYSVEATKTTIENYFSLRSVCPEICEPLPKNLLEKNAQIAYVGVIPAYTPKDWGIVFMKLVDYKPENFNTTELIALVYMMSALCLHEKGFYKGTVAVLDMKGFSLGHLARLNLHILKHALFYLQEAAPIRLKEVHIINVNSHLDKILTIIKPFVKMEIMKLMNFHLPNSETLFEYLPPECLPEDYGGRLPPTQVLNEEHTRHMLKNYDFFLWHKTQRPDESKRVAKLGNGHSFGWDGTFRRLEID